jgi:hypothetical protein
MTYPIQRFKKSFTLGILFWLVLPLLAPGQSQVTHASEINAPENQRFFIEARRWTEAEKIFRSDPRWLGGDGATSIDLGSGRILWLFGDSFIDPSGSGVRRTSDLVRNSIAIQKGYDPTRAEMSFFWKSKGAKPSAFFERKGEHWFWPASGIMVGKRLLIFLMEIQPADNELGFAACGWKAVLIDNLQETPDQWKSTYLISPQKDGLVVGSGNPLIENGFLQVFAADGKDRAVYLTRWPERLARAGNLKNPQWWAGETAGWVDGHDRSVKPREIITQGQMEFTVEYVPELKCYLQIQTLSIMNPCLAMASASKPTGPWTSQTCFFAPAEQGLPDLLIYAGKSHPVLAGADMAFTYVINAVKEEKLLKDMSIYFPVLLQGRIIEGETPPQ